MDTPSLPENDSSTESMEVSTGEPPNTEVGDKELALNESPGTTESEPTAALRKLLLTSEQNKPEPRFMLFLLLPTELRLKIWDFALTRREVNQVYTRWNQEAYDNWDPMHRNDTMIISIAGKNNKARYACRESYEAGRESRFELLCAPPQSVVWPDAQNPGPKVIVRGRTGKFINFGTEELVIGPAGLSTLPVVISQLNIRNLERVILAVDQTRASSVRDACVFLRSQCPKLKHIKLVCAWSPSWSRTKQTSKNVRFVEFDSNVADLMNSWAQRMPRGRHREALEDCVLMLLLKKHALRTTVKQYLERQSQWGCVRVEIHIQVRQDLVSKEWTLRLCTTPWVRGENREVRQEVVYLKNGSMASRYDGVALLFREK